MANSVFRNWINANLFRFGNGKQYSSYFIPNSFNMVMVIQPFFSNLLPIVLSVDMLLSILDIYAGDTFLARCPSPGTSSQGCTSAASWQVS